MTRLTYKSKNLNRRYLRAARIIAGKIARIDGVVGIVATGGLGRGCSDDYSYPDPTAYAAQEKVKATDLYITIA